MIVGVNTHFSCNGSDFHIQIEDLDASKEFEARVYVGGGIVFHKRQGYSQAVEGLQNPRHIDTALNEEMAKFLALIKAAITKGRITAT